MISKVVLCSILFFMCISVNAVAAEISLDDFEDGSDAGWNVVGHGSFLGQYHKSAVSPGRESAFALRLSRDSLDGWCGVGISFGNLKLARCEAIRVAVRNAKGVEGVLVDIHCSDGSRWWYKAPVDAKGGWTLIEARPEHFFAIENPKKLAKPDLRKAGTLWLVMDKIQGKSSAPLMMDIDDVALVGESVVSGQSGAGRSSAAVVQKPTWKASKVKIGVVDADAFLASAPKVNLAEALVKTLTASGALAELIKPEDVGARLDGRQIDLLVWSGPAFAVGDEKRVLSHLKAGRSFWYIGAAPMFSGPMEKREGKWQVVKGWQADPELGRILETWPQGKHWVELDQPEFEVTPQAKAWWKDLPDCLPASKCQFLAADDSIAWPRTPPWVEVTPLLSVRYVSRNWVYLDDTFTGWVMVQFAHRAGPFAGAKILFAGLPNDLRSILHPANAHFAEVVVKCAEELASPVKDRWEKIPAAPLAGLPELTRKNFFDYPGPVFAPLNFGGFATDDPTFWEDMDLAGFNAIHVSVPFLDQADAQGEIIDWRRAAQFVTTAKAHGKRIIFDPYDFSSNRWQWSGEQVTCNTGFLNKYAGALGKLAARYKDDPTVVAMFVAPLSVGYGSFVVDSSEFGKKAWREYVRDVLKLSLAQVSTRYGKKTGKWEDLPLPGGRTAGKYSVSPLWSDYLDFFVASHYRFMRTAIRSIRVAAPDMPLLMRGQYLDLGIHMKLASEFSGVAPHCECVETTFDTDAYFRGPALTFRVPIGAENGWPKIHGGPLRMALADYLMGGYSYFLYSFAGPAYARPGMLDFHQAQKAARVLRQARYPETHTALLIPDTTLYASEPANFFALEKLPHLEFAMERFNFNFRAVSAQFPDFSGLKVLVDDGCNSVLTQACRAKLVEWIRQGGTLIAFPQTGRYDFAGGDESLEKALGVSFAEGELQVGKGRVIVLPQVPVREDDLNRLEELLAKCGAKRDVVVTPRVNSACFRTELRTYLVVCNKSPRYVGSYFKESTRPEVEASLPDLKLTVKPNFAFKKARNVVTEQVYEIRDGAIAVDLPKTTFAVIEFER